MQTAVLAFLGLATLFAGFVLRLILPGLRYYEWAILAIGAALLVVSVMLDFRQVKRALGSRRGKFGIGTTVKISLFSGIILLANAISVDTYHRFDVTGLAQFSLTSQTKEVLAELEHPVEVVNFFTPSVPPTVSMYARNLLEEYQVYTDQLTVRDVDPDLNPELARRYQVDQVGALYGVTVFRSEKGQQLVYGPQISAEAEHAFTSAILEVTGIRQKKLYFITGHGEGSIYSEYESARSGLQDNLFQVNELDLLRSPAIPHDTACLVLAGPQQSLSGIELEILKNYLQSCGCMLVLLNPNPPQRLRELLADWYLDIETGTIIDPSSYVAPNKDTPLIPRTRNRFGLIETYFPGATAVIPQEAIPENVKTAPLVWTSPESWLEKEYEAGVDPQLDESADVAGPLAIGAMISKSPADEEKKKKEMRVVVIGDSDFATNRHFRNGNNSDLFLTTVNWLTAGEEIISVDRKVLPVRRLILSPEEARFLHISSVGLLPLVLFLVGGYLWWRRR